MMRNCWRPVPNAQNFGPSLVACPRLLLQHIRNYPPYLEAFSSVCNFAMRHLVLTKDPLIFLKHAMYLNIMFENSACPSQETHLVSITHVYRVMLFKETVTLCCRNLTKHTKYTV
jgi:hypothetical protein